MRHSPRLALALATLVAMSALSSPTRAAAQAPAPSSPAASALVRPLSVDEAVRLALEQNLGLEAERVKPLIQGVEIARARGLWAPTFTSYFGGESASTPSTNVFSGGETKVTDKRFATEFGLSQILPTGGSYTLSWDGSRTTSTNFFTNYDPLLNTNIRFAVAQPLLRNLKIDSTRQQMEQSERQRDAADISLKQAIALTTREVRNAYWNLISQIDALQAARQSLDLARRLLADNERRVKVGTMAPIDIVEAQSEVARNEEAVIVAEAAIDDAQDRLRGLVYRPDNIPEFWQLTIRPTDAAPYRAESIDVDGAIRRAVSERTDLHLARNRLAQSDISLRFLRNQILPDITAQASYGATAAGGSQLSPLTSIPIGEPAARAVIARRGYGSVLGDILTNAFPSWSVGMTVSYPIGTSIEEAALARVKLEVAQQQTELKNLELQATLEVRNIARQVQTNQKRVDSTQVARQLAERRLEAAEKKFAAGVETTFFVFQAQRDLTQARTNEVRAIADYNRSLVDFEAVQQVPLATVSGSATAQTSPAASTPTP